MSYYDEKISIEGILWKLKSTFTGTKKWKKCWVTMVIKEKKRKNNIDINSDPNLLHNFHHNTKIRLYQWSEAYKPSIMSGKKPKYTLDIKDCSLTDYPLHPYSFVLTERASKTTLIFACEDPNLHNQWMKCIDEAFSIMKTIIENQNEDENNNKSILLKNKSNALQKDSLSIAHYSFSESLEHSIEQRMSLPSIAEEDLEEYEQDISNCNLVYKYFRKKNIFEKEIENPYIEIEEDLEYLIYEIDSSIDREVIMQFIKLDLDLLTENIISYNEFHAWWKANSNRLELPLSPIIPPLELLVGGGIADKSLEDTAAMEEIVVKPKILLDQNHIDTIHLLGFIDNTAIHSNMIRQSYRNNYLLHISLIPDCPEISSRHIEKYDGSAITSQYDDYTDLDCGWNQAYQSYLTSLAHVKIPREKVVLVSDKIDHTNEYANNVEGEEGSDKVLSNNEYNHPNNEYYDKEKEMNINELQQVEAQVEAPASTSISQVISPNATTNTSQSPPHCCNNSSKSQELKRMSPLFTTLTNFNHFKGNFYDTVFKDVYQIIDDYCLPDQLKRIKLSQKSTKDNDIYESSGLIYYIIDCSCKEDGYLPTKEFLDRIHSYDEIKRKMASNEFRNTCYVANALKKDYHHEQEIRSRISVACTMLSIVVDYAGFRVVAVSPVPLDQNNSLVFGCKSKASTGFSSDMFINTLDSISEQSTVISDLAKQLNLQVYERSYRISRTDEQKMNIITNDLQMHRSTDGRLYVTNVASLLPIDFPRANSFDVYTKQLRPEYIALSNHLFYADLLQTNISFLNNNSSCSSNTMNNSNNTNEIFKSSLDEELWSEAIANNLQCNTALYQQLLPTLAHSLDSCSVMLLDSYGFTEWLHSNGVNCRHIGMLLSFCKSNVAKLLLLSEAIARCCKNILTSKLRTMTRKYYADNLRAMHRKHSKTEYYLEVKEHLMLQRKEIVLNIFNLVLGCGDLRDEFWNGPLHDALYYKFGIEATSFYLLSQMHFPQLFIATQYHLGTRFNDSAVYNMNVPGVIYPFKLQNILEYLIPSVPSLTTSANIPGPVGNIPSFSNSYIIHGLYEHASKALELQYFIESSLTLYKLYDTTNTNNDNNESIKIPFTYQYCIAHTLYKLVLSYYLSQDYLSALKYSRTYLSIFPHYHPITGRMLSLLMCIEWNLGNVEKAQLYFDATQEIYNYTLGANHPILIHHIHCFSSLYMSLPNKKGYSQGKLLSLLAYAKSKQTLSENHIITATYQVMVAEIYMNEMKHKSAIELLVNSSNVFINSQNVMDHQVFMKDSIRSLYNLSVCYHSIGNFPKAKDVLIECISIYNFDMDNINDNINYIHLSALLLQSDVYLQSNEIDESLNSLYKGWYVMCDINKYASKYKRNLTEKIMSNLVKKSFSLLLNSLNMSTKSLFESIVDEWIQQQSLQYLDTQDIKFTNNDNNNINNILKNNNNMKGLDIESQKVLLNMIWDLGPFQYFELVMDGIEKHELAPTEEDDTLTNNVNINNNVITAATLVPLPAQAAFILSLTKNEINIFNHNIQAIVTEDIDINKEFDML